MTNNKNKSMMISTIVLFVGIAIISLYSFMPANSTNKVLEKYKINFDDEGKSIAAIEIEGGKFITKPEDPVREGYIFVGWEVDGELFDFSKEVNGNVNLVARWQKIEPDKVYYTVMFNTDGGSTIGNQVIEENNMATRPMDDPVKEGFTFVGWQLDGVDFDFNTPITGDITITAIWEEAVVEPPIPDEPDEPEEKTFTVRFNGNGGTLGSGCANQTVKSGETAANSCTATRNGYTFVGFNTNSRATSAQNVGTRKITANTTYYAIWKQIPVEPPKVEKITVTFDFAGGSAGTCSNTMQVDKGTRGSSITCRPTRQYYTFANWNIQGALNGNTTLTAQWNKQTFKVSCNKAGGPADQTCVVAVAGLSSSAISDLSVNIKGKTMAAKKNAAGDYTLNANVWEQSTGNITIGINGQSEKFNGTK